MIELSFLRKIEKLVETLEVACMVAVNYALLAVVIIMVLCRYALFVATPWADELARLLFVYAVFLGCGYITGQWKHLDIQLIDKLIADHAKNPEKVQKAVKYISYLISLVTLLIITFNYWKYLGRVPGALTAALRISNKTSLYSAFIGFILMDFHLICRLVLPDLKAATAEEEVNE